jgi:hypothetical protein
MPSGEKYQQRLMQKAARGSSFSPVAHVLKSGKYAGIIVASGLAYAIAYMIIVGVISYVPGLSSITGLPVLRTTSLGLSSIVPAPGVFFFIFYSALAFLIASSFLVGLNVSLLLYSRKMSKGCGLKKTGAKGFLGIFPAFFTSFSCCGGGILALAIGPAAFSSLSLYSGYMAPLTIAALAGGTYLMSCKISRRG